MRLAGVRFEVVEGEGLIPLAVDLPAPAGPGLGPLVTESHASSSLSGFAPENGAEVHPVKHSFGEGESGG